MYSRDGLCRWVDVDGLGGCVIERGDSIIYLFIYGEELKLSVMEVGGGEGFGMWGGGSLFVVGAGGGEG